MAEGRDITAEVKRMWVHAEWRGCGLGARLLGGPQDRTLELLRAQAEVLAAIPVEGELGGQAIERRGEPVELVLAFEEAFEIDIPDEDTEKIRTVQDAINYIETHAKK